MASGGAIVVGGGGTSATESSTTTAKAVVVSLEVVLVPPPPTTGHIYLKTFFASSKYGEPSISHLGQYVSIIFIFWGNFEIEKLR